MAGPDLVTWELTALGPDGDGPFRLVVHHSAGRITEFFDSVTGALIRRAELEALLIAARGAAPSDSIPVATKASQAGAKRSAPTILVVDDDLTVTETFATALHREG